VKRTALFRLFGALVLIVSLVGGWLWIGLRTFAEAPVGNESTVILEVPPGITPPRLAARLAAEGVIDRPTYFLWLLRLRGADRRLQAGEYEIPPGITVETLVQNLTWPSSPAPCGPWNGRWTKNGPDGRRGCP